MQKLIKPIQKGWHILSHRLKTQGLKITLIWLYGRGLPKLTGIPLAKYSRITRQIYVGPQFRRPGRRHLERLGITGLVNMRVEFDDAAHDLLVGRYCHLPTIDDHAPTMADLDEGVTFIRQIVAAGGKVYIHCAGGVGRAPTMAAAYFICHGLNLDDALALIKKTRPFINIMPVQLAQLRRLEQRELTRQQVEPAEIDQTEV